LDIIFKRKKFAEESNQQDLLLKRHGPHRGKLLRRRLDDLRAAASLHEMRMLPGRCHELKGDRSAELSMDLDGPYRLIFEVANNPIPLEGDGGLDWTQVTSINILGVEDTHG
jgi:proteic killer suppression protein